MNIGSGLEEYILIQNKVKEVYGISYFSFCYGDFWRNR